MIKNNIYQLISLFLIAFILFGCGAPGTQVSSPAPEIDAGDMRTDSTTEEPTEPIPNEAPAVTDTPKPSPSPSVSQEDLIETWRPAIGSYFLVIAGCKVTEEMLLEFKDSGGGAADMFGASLVVGLFLNAIREGVLEWEPPADIQAYKDYSLNHLDSIMETVGAWSNDGLAVDEAIDETSATCQTIETEFEIMGNTARQAGLTEESMQVIGQNIEELVTELQEGIEFDEGEEEVLVSTELGMSRANPFPLGEMQSTPNWDIQVVENIRGDAAWQLIQAANSFNDPPAEGMEYILIKIKVISTYEDSDEHSISNWDFNLTGGNLIQYDPASIVEPEPILDATLFTGGETEGWVAFAVGKNEDNLILIFDEVANWEEDRFRFFSIEDGASISIDQNLNQIQPTDLGVERSSPAPFGETVITENWEVAVKEVIRGEEAWQLVQSANQFNDPPEEGMEYILAKLLVRNIGTTDASGDMDGLSFESTGGNNVLYDLPSVVEPEPALDVSLFSGGSFEGWITLLAAEGESNMMAVFTPWTDWDDTNRRFLALEP